MRWGGGRGRVRRNGGTRVAESGASGNHRSAALLHHERSEGSSGLRRSRSARHEEADAPGSPYRRSAVPPGPHRVDAVLDARLRVGRHRGRITHSQIERWRCDPGSCPRPTTSAAARPYLSHRGFAGPLGPGGLSAQAAHGPGHEPDLRTGSLSVAAKLRTYFTAAARTLDPRPLGVLRRIPNRTRRMLAVSHYLRRRPSFQIRLGGAGRPRRVARDPKQGKEAAA